MNEGVTADIPGRCPGEHASPHEAFDRLEWSWLGRLTLALWAALVLAATAPAGAMLATLYAPDLYYLLYVASVFSAALLLPIVFIHIIACVAALVLGSAPLRTVSAGILSGLLVGVGDLGLWHAAAYISP